MERVRPEEGASAPKYGLMASMGAGDDGLPKLKITRTLGPRTVVNPPHTLDTKVELIDMLGSRRALTCRT